MLGVKWTLRQSFSAVVTLPAPGLAVLFKVSRLCNVGPVIWTPQNLVALSRRRTQSKRTFCPGKLLTPF